MQQKPTRSRSRTRRTNGLKNDAGTVAMARTSVPHSATAQFFINVKDNDFLNYHRRSDGWGYAVFGKVVDGMDVVDEDRQDPGRTGPASDVPRQPVVIESMTLVAAKK